MKLEREVHATAVIEEGAEIGEGVKVGAYAYIGRGVKLGKGTVVHHHATVEGKTVMGEWNEVFPYAYIGGKTHDLKYEGGEPGLVIGNGNVFREYVTVHVATKEGDYTVIGDKNVLLAYSHVAHDCEVGNGMVMSSHAALGGHVIVEDKVTVGWSSGVHQFCRLGRYCMIGACTKVVQNVLPYMLVDGNPARVVTYNRVGLERAGFTAEELGEVKGIYQVFYRKGLNVSQAVECLRGGKCGELGEKVLEFIGGNNRHGRGIV